MRLHRRCPFLLAFLLLPRGKHFSAAERGQVRLDAASTANTRAKMFPHTARTHSGFPGPTAAQGRAQLGAECRGAAHCPTATKGGHLITPPPSAQPLGRVPQHTEPGPNPPCTYSTRYRYRYAGGKAPVHRYNQRGLL